VVPKSRCRDEEKIPEESAAGAVPAIQICASLPVGTRMRHAGLRESVRAEGQLTGSVRPVSQCEDHVV